MKPEINTDPKPQGEQGGGGLSTVCPRPMCPVPPPKEIRRAGERSCTRMIVAGAICFGLGIFVGRGFGAGAGWFSPPAATGVVARSERVDQPTPTGEAARSSEVQPSAPPVDFAALETVQRAIPNVSTASLEGGTRILRKAALSEFEQTMRDLQERQKKAEKDFIDGQNQRSEEQQKMAAKQIQELQAERMEKLKQIAANSRAQIETFQRMKETLR